MKMPKRPLTRSPKKQKKRLKVKIRRRLKSLGLVIVLLISILFLSKHMRLRAEQNAFERADQLQFINLIGDTARELAAEHDLYASVMVAQAILESDWGQSQLTREANNLFGIKGDYWGQTYTIETSEDDGTGKLYTILAQFRKYPTYHASLEDNAKLLSRGLIEAPDFYMGTWRSRTSSYQDATAYLQGRYATDTQYASKLNALIEQYDLTRFDNP